MSDLLKLIWYAVARLFRSRAALQTEVLALRHQLNVLRRRAPRRATRAACAYVQPSLRREDLPSRAS